ncbi:hypothetical protein Pmani_019704 [Petrolisthes manimaculis]|uniref:Uncharacterized protein n=1 Tax=Petrolisthes manimaculis TaxID=1843537 RepID=A0AAE1PH52_9EUCA|nr:hypothetical protein Pmani_019704 [Petrolisthes manimaculis]
MAHTSGHNEVWPENPTALATPPQRPHYNKRNTTNTKATTSLLRPQHHKGHNTTRTTTPLLRPHHHKGHTHYYLNLV